MGKRIKNAQEKLRRRLSGRLFRYTFTFSLAVHFGLWGLVGFSPRDADPGYSAVPERRGPEVRVNPPREVEPDDLPQPPTIVPETPDRMPEGLPGTVGLGEIIIPTPDDQTDITTIKDATPVTKPIDPNEKIIIIDPAVDPDKPRSASPDTIEFVEYSQAPVVVTMVQPRYPEIAYSSGVEGQVILMVYVDEQGRVRNAAVQSSPGLPAMEEAAVEAAYKCTFKPARQQGVPVGVWHSMVMEFRL